MEINYFLSSSCKEEFGFAPLPLALLKKIGAGGLIWNEIECVKQQNN